ncbi:MAG: zinc ribbon domain-containing protein [Lachnospiraceae bacterium]
MFCMNCGKEIADNAEFCKFCGARKNSTGQKVIGNTGSNLSSPYERQEPYIPPRPHIGISDNLKTLIIVVVVLLAVFYAVYKYAESSAQKQKKNDPTTIDYDYQMYGDYDNLNNLNNMLDSYDW